MKPSLLILTTEAVAEVLHDELKAKLLDVTASAAIFVERASRVQTELDRTRAHELHLIQDRDRLIHQDIATLNKQVHELIAERDAERSACRRFSEHLGKAESELMASQERERRLSERLASIASLVTDM